MMERKDWQITLTIACACLGLLLSLQITTHRAMAEDLNYQSNETLAAIAKNLTTKYYQLIQEVWDLRTQQKLMEQSVDQNEATREAMTRELQKLKISLGALPVQGPGIILTVQDNDLNFLTYQDIINIVNELWNAGAEAISVNGYRITNNTSIKSGADYATVLVNGKALSYPYIIEALGEPTALESGISIPSGIIDNLRTIYRIPLEIEQSDQIKLKSDSVPQFKFAEPVPSK